MNNIIYADFASLISIARLIISAFFLTLAIFFTFGVFCAVEEALAGGFNDVDDMDLLKTFAFTCVGFVDILIAPRIFLGYFSSGSTYLYE